MNESDKKRLTKWLDECWHDSWSQCTKCERYYVKQRDFTSPADFFACFDKLVELGEWTKFEWWSIQRQPIGSVSYIQWLLSRTESGHYRLCVLVAEWLKEGK
jgi:hypothetical protein